jgi:hypothetical protein
MPKLLLLTSAILLLPNHCFAQDLQNHPNPTQCQQIRQAVAQYGYASVRQYALENYGAEVVKLGEQCFAHQLRRPGGHDSVRVVPIDER